jgi:VWFA-related protein
MTRRNAPFLPFFCVALALAFLALPSPARAQAPPGPIHTKPGAHAEDVPTAEQRKHTIRVRVDEVTTPVTVLDLAGEMVFNLTKENFHLFDNGAEQKIEHFDLGGDPLSIVLVIETSSHIEPMFPAVRHTGIIFAETVMGLTSEAAVIGYDDNVDLLQKFTTDSDGVQNVVDHLRMGTSGTRLYDAMSRGISLLEQRPPIRRRIMVVVGEAQDAGSENKLGEVLRQAHLANVIIYSIGLSTTMADLRAKPKEPSQGIGPPGTFPVPTPRGQPQTPQAEQAAQQGNIDYLALAIWLIKTGKNALGQNSLAIASKATGGLHLNTVRDRTIERALDSIGGEIHAQYTLGYRPPGNEPSGFHDIKVVVDRPGVTVRSRPGYYLPPPDSD